MERLKFTYSLDINRQQFHEIFPKVQGISHIFFTAYEGGFIEWQFEFSHSTDPRHLFSECKLNARAYPINVSSRCCSCKFTLKRADHPNLELTLVQEKEFKYATHSPGFEVPNEHGILKFLANLFTNPKEIPAILELEIELPKNSFFAKLWPFALKMAPDGCEKDKRYRNLTIEDKHNFHIVCKDGVFYAKKRDLIDYCPYFMEMFEEDWKDKNEVELEISLETMKMAAAYYFTRTFLAPKKLNPPVLEEITKTSQEFGLGRTFSETMDVFVCRHLTETSLSLQDLISWWRAAYGLVRVKGMIESKLDRNHYSEIVTQYKADAKFENNENKEIHKLLHEKIRKYHFMESYESLFEKIVWFHSINQKMTVTEVVNTK